MMILTLLALVSLFLGLIAIYVLNVFTIKSIIRDIAYNLKYFVKTHDLTNEAIKTSLGRNTTDYSGLLQVLGYCR